MEDKKRKKGGQFTYKIFFHCLEERVEALNDALPVTQRIFFAKEST